ncbi:MAG: hypothetical protein JW782_06370 [Candidatus Saganbacteria bacterium]|nr:hypothetical protein [Candidatus Saganbacteria bacterium]
MIDYNRYIEQLKAHEAPVDHDLLYTKVQARLSRSFPVPRLALVGALAVLALAFGIYYGARLQQPQAAVTDDEVVMSYVFESEKNIDGPVVSYVLANW